MAQITWDDTFAVGNDALDRQHKKWLELYNSFDSIMLQTTPLVDSVAMQLDALQLMHEYTLYHFRYEENLMASLNFPELPHHWRLHKDFDYKIFAYIRKLETGKLISSNEIVDMVRQWLLGHLVSEDKRLRLFLEERATQHTIG